MACLENYDNIKMHTCIRISMSCDQFKWYHFLNSGYCFIKSQPKPIAWKLVSSYRGVNMPKMDLNGSNATKA